MWHSISVVIPVYNSRDSLEELYERLSTVFKSICNHYEIILVDDGSQDNSYEIMQRLHHKDPKVKIIQLNGNFGQQNALMCGFYYAYGDYVVTIDDDLQHRPEEIYKMIQKLDDGYDVVFGIPIKKQHSFYRNIGSKMTDYLFNKICLKPKNIKVSSFRAIKKNIIEQIIKDETSFVYISAIIYKNTQNIGNVHVKHDARKYGKSNYNFIKLFKLFTKLYIYYSNTLFFRGFKRSCPQFEIKDKGLKRRKTG